MVKKSIQRFFLVVKVILIAALLLIIISNVIVKASTCSRLYDRIKDVPFNRVGLILGTSKRVRRGRINLYFLYRIRAAVQLLKYKKIKYIIVSGDNRSTYYNEPVDMRNALLRRGVAKEVIFMDYAGLRTLDSVVRAKKVFGQDKITIISQRFHNERAVFIAQRSGIDAIGYNARDVKTRSKGLRVRIREIFARAFVFLDIYIFNTEPHFLGKPISIP